MALTCALRLWLSCLLICSVAPKPACDPSACPPCPEGSPEGNLEGNLEGNPEGNPEKSPEERPEGNPEGNPEENLEGNPEGRPEENPEGNPEDNLEGNPEGNPEGTATPTAGSCCPPCPRPCACPPYLQSDCEMQGFASGLVPAGRSFYIDFARRLCTCQPAGDITCAPRCPQPGPACLALGSPLADGCPQCVCYDEEGMAVAAGTVTARGSQMCTCPARGGRLQCQPAASQG